MFCNRFPNLALGLTTSFVASRSTPTTVDKPTDATSNTATSSAKKETATSEHNNDLLFPTRLEPLGWIDRLPEGTQLLLDDSFSTKNFIAGNVIGNRINSVDNNLKDIPTAT